MLYRSPCILFKVDTIRLYLKVAAKLSIPYTMINLTVDLFYNNSSYIEKFERSKKMGKDSE